MTGPVPASLREERPRLRLQAPPGLHWIGLGLLVTLSLYLISPYLSLWRLDQTAVNGPTAALDPLVDLDAVSEQIIRRLNKDQDSAIGEVSDAFIDWLQENIRRNGEDALRQTVSLAWVRERLLSHSNSARGFWPALSYAFFDGPTSFRVRIGPPLEAAGTRERKAPAPVHLRLERGWLRWRVTALSY